MGGIMAQEVGYYENDVVFLEGPFVLVNINGWRIEVERKGHSCPILPEQRIFQLEKSLGLSGKTRDRELAAVVCDKLNSLVKEGKIIEINGHWTLKGEEVAPCSAI